VAAVWGLIRTGTPKPNPNKARQKAMCISVETMKMPRAVNCTKGDKRGEGKAASKPLPYTT
jgi:hypothetical protein